MQVHKVNLLICDFDGIGADQARTTLEYTKYPNHCIKPCVLDVQTAEIGEWDDNNPLNFSDRMGAEVDRLFPAKQS